MTASSSERQPVLVTGGSGYIGSHVVRALAGRCRVVVIDLRPAPPAIADTAHFVRGDIRDAALLDRVLGEERIGGVIHLAGLKSVSASLADPGGYFDTNVRGSVVLLEAMARAGVHHIIFSSSAAVYGTPDELPVTEAAPTRPENPYGESKLMVERMLPWFERAHGIRHVSLRYFNAAGASPAGDIGEDWSDAVNLVPVVMRAALGAGPPVEVFGTDYPTPDGSAVRDYIHVVDLADAHIAALDHLSAGGQSVALNLGTGAGASVLEVVETVRRIGGVDVPTVLGTRREGDPPAVWAGTDQAARVLGWRASRGLDEIVATAWRWHARESN